MAVSTIDRPQPTGFDDVWNFIFPTYWFPWFDHSRLALTTPSASDSTEVYYHRDHHGPRWALLPCIQPRGCAVTLADIRHRQYPPERIRISIPSRLGPNIKGRYRKMFVRSILDIHGMKGDEKEIRSVRLRERASKRAESRVE